MAEIVEVRVEQDHLRRLIGTQPVKAIAELIWNAVDADARRVVVKVIESPLGGVEEVRVVDDGHGMTFQEAKEEFGHLGGSWKRRLKRSRGQGRFLHGSKGQGRWRAYAIGARIRWTSVADDRKLGYRTRVTIKGTRESLGIFSISEPEHVASETGTTVIVDGIGNHPKGLLKGEAVKRLTAEFATYLEANTVEILYRATSLNPSGLKSHEAHYDIELSGMEPETSTLTIIE